MTKNLWGTLPDTETIRTPHAVLTEQAALLGEMTNGLLVGKVKRRSAPPDNPFAPQQQGFELRLLIVAPALNNYSYTVMTIFYPMATLYPVKVENNNGNKPVTCQSEEELMQVLGQVLSAEKTRRVIASLLGQIRAESVTATPVV